ncbi:MAG: class I SAM-dependent methyltransferase [Bacteroidaceae bacterium]|nr:class I SAM-dependent methyltransferase [Bacteroidaceae bacterium]
MTIDEYIESHCSPEDSLLHDLYRATNVHLLRPRMASGHVQGSFLRMLVGLTGARRVLEIGTFSGYATLCMAAALPEGGKIVTYEVNDEQEEFTRPWFERSEWNDRIDFRIGDALESLPAAISEESELFDMAYVDGNKRQYTEYYERILPLLRPGGLYIADNTLWSDHVIDSHYHDAQTEGIRHFNDLVAHDERVETVLLPLRDGLTLIRKK